MGATIRTRWPTRQILGATSRTRWPTRQMLGATSRTRWPTRQILGATSSEPQLAQAACSEALQQNLGISHPNSSTLYHQQDVVERQLP